MIAGGSSDNTYKIGLSVGAIYWGEKNNVSNGVMSMFETKQGTTEKALCTDKVHAYDYNTAVLKNVIASGTTISFDKIAGGNYQYGFYSEGENLYLIFKNDGNINCIDCSVQVKVFGYNSLGYAIGSVILP